jgi:hypothetical protein
MAGSIDAVRSHQLLRVALGVGGWTFGALVAYWGLAFGWLVFPGGDDLMYLNVGRAFWSGADAYSLTVATQPFLYSPPWAAFFGLFPSVASIHIAIFIGSLLALRYIAGSWLAAGYLCWFPIVPWEAVWGNINILMAAAIVAGVRGHGAAPAALGLAKWSPFLSLSPRAWKSAALVLGIALIVTLPRLDQWFSWFSRLLWMMDHPLGPLVPIPLALRLAVALPLVALRRPWSRALGAVIATPAFYVASFVLLIAPVSVWLHDRKPAAGRRVSLPATRQTDRVTPQGLA